MDDLKLIKGQPYEVGTGTSSGLNLRREPTTNDKTKDGKNNVIVSLPNGTIVWLESEKPEKSDGHIWYHVRYTDVDGGIDETGWVASKYLYPTGLGRAPVEYTFKFIEKNKGKTIEKKYFVTEANLKSAVAKNYFSTSKLSNTQTEITLDKPFEKRTTYWVSKENLNNVPIDPIT